MAGSRLLFVDDHPLMREGLALAVRVALPEFVIDNAGTISEAERVVARNRGYRLALLDLMLPDAHGFSGFVRLQQALGNVPIVIISARQQPETIEASRTLGAVGYLCKTQPLEETLSAIRAMLAGNTVFPRVGTRNGPALDPRHRLSELSQAQLRVLTALADGRLNKEIAGDLGVTEATIKAHLTAIFRKLGVNNRTQAILALRPLPGESAGHDR